MMNERVLSVLNYESASVIFSADVLHVLPFVQMFVNESQFSLPFFFFLNMMWCYSSFNTGFTLEAM